MNDKIKKALETEAHMLGEVRDVVRKATDPTFTLTPKVFLSYAKKNLEQTIKTLDEILKALE